MSDLQQIYRHRWDDAELDSVNAVWQVLVRHFFQRLIGRDAVVLDIGCGFCHFLNHVRAKERVGVDANPGVKQYAAPGVTIHLTADLALPDLPNGYFDRVFLSNFLEHLNSADDVLALLRRVHELLKPGGRLLILQPNFSLLGPAYFDFIDHKTILTHTSLEEALEITGYRVLKKIVRFLPYTTKSRLPRHPLLVRLYLAVPLLWAIMGKQSLFVAAKPKHAAGSSVASQPIASLSAATASAATSSAASLPAVRGSTRERAHGA